MKKPFIAGITGGSASGKTLFLNRLTKAFTPDEICLVCQDHYYKQREEQPLDEKGMHNFDTPLSIDAAALTRDILTLSKGHEVEKEEYTFNNPGATPQKFVFKPAPLIIIEGIFVFYYPEIEALLDFKIFLDAKEHIKLKRRIIRDQEERGYGLEDVLYRYENHVAPAYTKYIEPFKDEADIVIPNNVHFERALEMVTVYLKSKIHR